MLKYKTVTYFQVDYSDFEDFIHAEYGQEYCFPADEECSNDTKHSFQVKKKELDEWDKKTVEEFKAGTTKSFMARTLLQDAVNRDVIPEGHYLVSISW